MLQPKIGKAMRASASQLEEARHNLKVSLDIDRGLMSDSRTAIESSQRLMRRIRQEESAKSSSRQI